MKMKIVNRRSNLSLLYLVIFLGDILTGGVRSKPVITGTNVNSLSKFESDFDKDYYTSYKNVSNLNTLPLIAVETSLQEPDMPHQEAISRMKITGQPTRVLSQEITQHIQSSEYNHIGSKTHTDHNTRGYSYTINPSPTKSSEDAFHRGTELLSDVDTTNIDSSITSWLNGNRKESRSAPIQSSYSQMSLTPSYDLYQTIYTQDILEQDHQSRSIEKVFLGLLDSDFRTSMAHVDLSDPVDFDPIIFSSSAHSESNSIEFKDYISKSGMNSFTENGQYLDDFTSIENQNSISTTELPQKSSLIELHPTLTFSTEQDSTSFYTYSTNPLFSIRGSFKDFESEIPGPSLPSSIISRTSFTEIRHDENLNIHKLAPAASQNELSSTNEETSSYFQPTMPNMHITQTDDVHSGFSILPSMTENPSSYPHLDNVATPALSTKHATVSIDPNDSNDSLEDDYMNTPLAIVPSTTVVAKTEPGYSDNANKIPKTPSLSRRHSDIFRTSILDVLDYTEQWTSITLPLGTNLISSYRTDTETNSIDISNTSFDITENPISLTATISTVSEFASFLTLNNITEKDISVTKSQSQSGSITSVIDIRPSSSFSSLSSVVPSFSSSPLIPSLALSSLLSQSISSSLSPSSSLSSSLSSSSLSSLSSISLSPSSPSLSSSSSTLLTLNKDDSKNEQGQQPPTEEATDEKDIVVKSDDKEIKIEININNIIQEEIPITTIGTTPTTTTSPQPSQLSLELIVVCAYMCQQRGLPIPPFCGCTLQAWLR